MFGGHERVVEEARLGPDVLEGRGGAAQEVPGGGAAGGCEEAVAGCLVGLFGGGGVEGIGGVGVRVEGDVHLAYLRVSQLLEEERDRGGIYLRHHGCCYGLGREAG